MARIKETGEVVEVYNYSKYDEAIQCMPCDSCGDYKSYGINEVKLFIPERTDSITSDNSEQLEDLNKLVNMFNKYISDIMHKNNTELMEKMINNNMYSYNLITK